MPGPGSVVPINLILAALREKIAQTSLRQTAREVGMSPSGLHRVLDAGGSPWAKTRAKLQQWYMKSAATSGSTAPETARAAIEVLLAGMSAREKRVVERRLLVYLAELHGPGRVPDWLEKLRDEG